MIWKTARILTIMMILKKRINGNLVYHKDTNSKYILESRI